jgi:hypothetical protein
MVEKMVERKVGNSVDMMAEHSVGKKAVDLVEQLVD